MVTTPVGQIRCNCWSERMQVTGQVECKWVVKWNAISQFRRRNLELKPVLGSNCRHKTPDAERSSTGTDDSKNITSFL